MDCDDSLSEPWLDSSPLDFLCSDEDVGPAELLDSLVDFSWLDEVIGDDPDDCFPDDFSDELACDLDSELVSLLMGVEGENESDLLVPDDFLEADDSIVELPEWDDLLEGTPLLDSFLDCDAEEDRLLVSLREPWLDLTELSSLEILCPDDVDPADDSWLDELIWDDPHFSSEEDCSADDFSFLELVSDLEPE